MRSAKHAPASHWTPMRWAKRLAQAAPDPDPSTAGGDPPAAGDGAAPASPAAPAAQDATPQAPESVQTTAAAPEPNTGLSDAELARLAEEEAKTEVIPVTGTLIDRKEVDSASPISVVGRDKLNAAGITNLGDILQKIPAQGNAINAQNNNGGDGSTRINLRSLGTARTLVLINGRRVVPSGLGADDSVDFGTIPLAMVERVEVLKDGASAIYGSDAVAGVLNVITRSNMNGTEANIYSSTSQKRDGTNYDLSFVTGHSSDRGNITFSAGYQQQEPVMAGDRDFAKQTYKYHYCAPADAAAGTCTQLTLNGSLSTPNGHIDRQPDPDAPPLNIPGCTAAACTADGHGGFRNFIDPTATSFGDNYNFQPLNYLVTPSTRVNLFSNGRYDLGKNTHAFFEGQFNARKSTQQLAEEPIDTGLSSAPISKDSMYNPLSQDIVSYNRRLVEFGPRVFKQEVNTSRVVVGLNGTIDQDAPIAKNWKWEASYDFGRTDGTNSTRGDLILSHLVNALGPSFMDPADGPTCGTPGHVIAGCVPLKLLDPNHVTPEMIKYLVFTGTQSGFNEQHTTQLTASGKLLDLPNHGDISLAVGGDYRHEQGGFQPDPLTASGDTTGIATEATEGSYRTFEGFGELSVVPIAGHDLLKWVELDAAGRAYHYNTFGSGVTGKISGLVRTVGGLAVRGTYGNAFRAPNISELFAGQAEGFPGVDDPCDTRPSGSPGPITLPDVARLKCKDQGVPANFASGKSQQRALGGGNTHLQPEKAKVGTAGIVYEPLKGLDFTLDYWHVQIDNAITALPVQTILAQCYESGIDKFCGQVQRDPVTHGISHIVDLNQNVGALQTSGLDFSAAYQYKNRAGTFRHAVEGTYLLMSNLDTGTVNAATMKENIIHGKGYFDLGVQPDLKFNILTAWSHPSGLGAGFNFQFVDSLQECNRNNCNSGANLRRDISKYATGDLYLDYGLKSRQGTTHITLGVNNVVDAAPPLIYNSTALNADPSAYNFQGRQFYLRLGQLF